MTYKGFRIKELGAFLQLADQVTSPKFIDPEHRIAFFYMKKRIEYEIITDADKDRILKKGFIEGREIEIVEPF